MSVHGLCKVNRFLVLWNLQHRNLGTDLIITTEIMVGWWFLLGCFVGTFSNLLSSFIDESIKW